MNGIQIDTADGAREFIREWGKLGGWEGRLKRAIGDLLRIKSIDEKYHRDTSKVDEAIKVMRDEQARRGFDA